MSVFSKAVAAWQRRWGIPTTGQDWPVVQTYQPVILVDRADRVVAPEVREIGLEEVDIAAGGAGLHTAAILTATQTTILVRGSTCNTAYSFRVLNPSQARYTATWGAHTGRIASTSGCTALVQAASNVPAAEVYPAATNTVQPGTANYRSFVWSGAALPVVLAPGWSIQYVNEVVNNSLTQLVFMWEEVPNLV